MMLRIRVGGLTILGRPDESTSRVEGLFVGPDGFEGWDDGPDIRRESVDRPGQHGEFDTPVFNGSRVISVDGHALAWSEAELGHLRNQIMGLGGFGDLMRITVDHQGSTLWADARRAAQPTFRDAGIRHGMLRARFAIHFVAPNPRKFGETRDFPAGAAALHYGNFPASPEIIVTGPKAGGYTITGPGGRQYVVTQALAAGQTHRIDMNTGWLYLNGVLQSGAVSQARTWAIPPGTSAVHTITGGTGSMTVRVPDTFL